MRINDETKILNFLKERKISFEREIGFFECRDKNPLPFDFCISEKNLLIEFNGAQHYYYSPMFHKTIRGFHLQKYHDWLKRKFAKNNNIQLLTVSYKDDIIKKLEEIL